MIIRKVAVGNSEEAFIEDTLSEGLNILLSDDNDKGKTIIIQSMLYALGNKPIFPNSFNYKDFVYYLEFEHNSEIYIIVRSGDEYVLKYSDKLGIFEGMSELKRFWNNNIFQLPMIPFQGEKRIVDMELFVQLFFVGQDSKDTSTIFNSGFYHKDDFRNMLLSYSGDFSSEITPKEIIKIKDKIRKLKARRKEQLNLSDFYKTVAVAPEYLSKIKDRDAFNKRVDEMDSITDLITEIKKKRNRLAAEKSLWNGTLKELNSLNRNIKVGELRCMDCDSNHIAYKGTSKSKYSFDISTPLMRKQIIESINEKISDFTEEIKKFDFEIQKQQEELNSLMDNEDITIENIVAYKMGYKSVADIEQTIDDIDKELEQYECTLKVGKSFSDEAKEEREKFYGRFMSLMNEKKKQIDIESEKEYEDIFTKRGTVVSGSEETVFYVSKLLASVEMTDHDCPIIMDSFRAEDLSTDKEKRVLELFGELRNQCILTTTLKTEEIGKYDDMKNVNIVDYSSHRTNKILNQYDLEEFKKFLQFQIDNDIDALIVCGTTGESSTMTKDEKIEIIKCAVEVTHKNESSTRKIPVIAGTGSNNTKEAIEMSKIAESLGVDGVLVVTPYYNKTTQTGLVAHYSAIAENIDIPIILYNVPSRTGMNIEPETCLELSKIDNIVAIKEASR